MTQQKLENVTVFLNKFSSPCRFVAMTLKQLNIECNIKTVNLAVREHKAPDYLAINSEGKIPGMKDGDFCLGERYVKAMIIRKLEEVTHFD